MSSDQVWRVCTSCKAEIKFEQTYWVCSVSTCNRKRMPMFFHTVSCWEAHLPTMRHREAYAVEKRAPSRGAWQRQQQDQEAASRKAPPAQKATRDQSGPVTRRRVASPGDDREASSGDVPRDILIVASKMKKYIKARSGMNTSDTVLVALSDHVRRVCDEAIRNAGADERKTVLDRDIPPVR